LSGKHAEARTTSRRPSRKFVPLVSALAVAALLVGGAGAAMNLGPARNTGAKVTDVAVPPPVSASPSHAAPDRASRGEMRAEPSPTPSRTPSKSPTRKPSQPAGGGTVTSSGSCEASYYGDGQKTANGENFDPNAFTAANKTLPFNTRVKVTNPKNGKSVVVRINDRGPFVAGRCLDLTTAAFAAIASLSSGVIDVKYDVLS
jgi:rare lipoprotein A